MAQLRSFITLLYFFIHSLAMPVADDDDDDDDNDDGCGSQSMDTSQPVQQLAISTVPAVVYVQDSPSAAILAPYQHPPTPHPSPTQHLHATLPMSYRDHTPAILGTVIGIMIALLAFFLSVRYVVQRRRMNADPFKDPPPSRFVAFRMGKPATKKRLSDESWVSPALPSLLSSSISPLSQDLELRRFACPQRKLVPVTTPVCTPTDTEFGSRLEFANGDPGSVIPVPPVQVPSPVYIPAFSPSPSLSSSSSLSPTPSTEPLSSHASNPARLSRLLSSTFRDSRISTSTTRPTTAHLIQAARSYAFAYRPSSVATNSLYTPPTPSARFAGTRSRTGFYPGTTDDGRAAGGTVRDTFSTVTTSNTDMFCTLPYLRCTTSEVQLAISPFVDPGSGSVNAQTSNGTSLGPSTSTGGDPQAVGTTLGLKLRLSDASEHARYRSRERERERERRRHRESGRERGGTAQWSRTDSQASMATATSMETVRSVRQRSGSLRVEVQEGRKEFKLRDSESVLREIGW